MRSVRFRFSRRPAMAAAVLGGAAVLFAALPTRGQQNRPTISFAVPAAAVRGESTRVTYDLTLPAGLQVPRNLRVRVVDARGQLTELLPVLIARRTPTWTGFRDLHTENYPPGVYSVTVEVDYVVQGSAEATAAAPVATLTVP